MAQDSGAQLDGLPDEAAEEEQEQPEVDSDGFKGSEVLSFKEVQALWEARIATGRDSGAQTDGPPDEAAEEEQEESEVDSFKGSEVDSLKEASEAGTPTSTRCPSEDSEVGSLGDLPPMALDLGRLKIEGLGETFQGRGGQLADPQGQPGAVQTTPRTLRIFELEERLAQAAELPKLLSLSRRRAHDLVRQTAAREAELARLRRRLLQRRAREMLRPRIISSTTTSVHQGPAVVKEVVSRPFSTVPRDQTYLGHRGPPAALPACRRPRIIFSTTTSAHQGPAVVKVVPRPFSTVPKDQTYLGHRGPPAALPARPWDSMAAYDA